MNTKVFWGLMAIIILILLESGNAVLAEQRVLRANLKEAHSEISSLNKRLTEERELYETCAKIGLRLGTALSEIYIREPDQTCDAMKAAQDVAHADGSISATGGILLNATEFEELFNKPLMEILPCQ